MEDIIVELSRQVPALLIFGGVALRALQFLRDERESRSRIEEARMESLRDINENCHAHANRLTSRCEDAFEKSDKVISENTRALGKIQVTVERLIDGVDCHCPED